jgi:hypothetical protein
MGLSTFDRESPHQIALNLPRRTSQGEYLRKDQSPLILLSPGRMVLVALR